MTDLAVDSSALVAILEDEPEGPRVLKALRAAGRRLLGSPTGVELSIVVARRRGEAGLVVLDALSVQLGLEILPFEAAHLSAARDAWLRYGKGRHAAALNLGDCMSYAVAKVAGVPLLCVGDDFRRTDLDLALRMPSP